MKLHCSSEEALTSFLRRCSTHRHLLQLEAQVAAHGLLHHHFLTPRILSASFVLGSPRHASLRFRTTHLSPNAIPWNVMFKGYTEGGFHHDTLELFDEMRLRDVRPNGYTFTFVLKSCAAVGAIRKAEGVHCFAVKTGFGSNLFVGTPLIDVYAAGGAVGSACKMFDEMLEKNVVTWTGIVRAYISAGNLAGARRKFDEAGERDIVLWNTMLSGYLKAGDVGAAKELFDQMPDRDLMAWNTMLHGYANGCDLDACVRFFNEMPERNEYSWNGLINGYLCHCRFSDALHAFRAMLRDSNMKPNEATIVTILSACSRTGALDQGKWVHVYAYGNGFRNSINIGNALIDMYAKCGRFESAIEVFCNMKVRDVVSWNAMILCLAMHGFGMEALQIFNQMKRAGLEPDGITFVGVLCACSHMGLVTEGISFFRSMIEESLITPCMEHYGCMVDLLGRSGMLSEALRFIKAMPIEADRVIWSSLLASSRNFGDVYSAELAMKELIRLQPVDGANHVALSNVYGALGRWREFATSKHMMRKNNAEKLPGCSSIEVNSVVVEFCSFDVNHPHIEIIYCLIQGLTEMSKLDLKVIDNEEILVTEYCL